MFISLKAGILHRKFLPWIQSNWLASHQHRQSPLLIKNGHNHFLLAIFITWLTSTFSYSLPTSLVISSYIFSCQIIHCHQCASYRLVLSADIQASPIINTWYWCQHLGGWENGCKWDGWECRKVTDNSGWAVSCEKKFVFAQWLWIPFHSWLRCPWSLNIIVGTFPEFSAGGGWIFV